MIPINEVAFLQTAGISLGILKPQINGFFILTKSAVVLNLELARFSWVEKNLRSSCEERRAPVPLKRIR